MHIAIAGNIGSGKSTLTALLAKHFQWKPHFENVDTNPYLMSFYEDMQRWSFNLQIYFLNSRFRQIVEIRKSGENVVQDRTIYEDAYIFAPNLHDMGLMDNWKEQANLLSSNIGDSISFILNDITDDQFVWMSEVFEEVAEQSQSQDFVDAIRTRALRIESK